MIEAFLAYLQVERRMSAHTLDAYRRDLLALSAWAGERDADVVALEPEQLRDFVSAAPDDHVKLFFPNAEGEIVRPTVGPNGLSLRPAVFSKSGRSWSDHS